MDAFFNDELVECGLETDQDPIYEYLNHEGIERLLEIESDLMTVDSSEKQVLTNEEAPQEGLLVNENGVPGLLLMAAEALEAKNWYGASTIISRLYQVLSCNENGEHSNVFDRLALFFTEGLHQRLNSRPHFVDSNEVSILEEGRTVLNQGNTTMSAFQMLQELTPYVKFAHFTANQAILEATRGDRDVHIIDFDIMDGIQWPPLMVDLSLRENASLKITATISSVASLQDRSNAEQTGRRLKEFADSINLPFTFNYFIMEKEHDFEAITKHQAGNFHPKVVANCVTNQFFMRRRSSSQVNIFLNGIKKLNPKVLVLVDEDFHSQKKSLSFVEHVCEALHHYNAIDDSIVTSFAVDYKSSIRLIENQLLGDKIKSSLRHFHSWEVPNEDVLKEFKQLRLSFRNVSQAKSLVGLFKGGYWVQNENCRVALYWKSRPLTTVSIWAPIHH